MVRSAQTEGAEYEPEIPDYDFEKALAALNITQEPFECSNGNVMGYAKPVERKIAVSPWHTILFARDFMRPHTFFATTAK